jgi:hypothetical protein
MENKKIFAGFWIRHIALFVDMLLLLIVMVPIML